MFGEQNILQKLSGAHPGETIYFDAVSPEDFEAALSTFSARSNLSALTGSTAAVQVHDLPTEYKGMVAKWTLQEKSLLDGLNLNDHVQIHQYWWGVKISFDHDAVTALTDAGLAVAGMLKAIGVPAWIAIIVSAVMGIFKVLDRGNGVDFFCNWAGIHWYFPR